MTGLIIATAISSILAVATFTQTFSIQTMPNVF